jgi:hypothetical protein
MPLTICTLGGDGTPDDELDIGPDAHVLLQAEADRLELPLLSRMDDYYEDAEYSPDDLGPLIDEAEVMRQRGDKRIGPWLADLIALARRAMKRKVGLAAICD